nr:TerB family tellurite resistance protein [Variovorax boronicumulans]
MLRTLKELFDAFTAPAAGQSLAQRAHTQQLAVAVLLVEVMRAEPGSGPAERAAVLTALRRKFDLADDELERLLELAQAEAQALYDYHRFTSLLNERFTQPQKVALVEALWTVAYADLHVAAHENHAILKIAELLHVTHGEYIAAKLHAKQAAGGAGAA